MDAARLRPLGIGEVLDAGIKIYRARFRALVIATTIVVAPMYVLFGLAQLSTAPDDSEFGSDFSGGFEGTAETDVSGEEVGLFVVGALLAGALLFVITQLATAVAVKIVATAYLGEEASWRDALRVMWARKRTIVWLSVLYGLLALAAISSVALLALVGIIPAVFWGTVVALGGFYFYISWLVTVPVLMTENLSAWQSMKRSWRLVRQRWWPVLFSVMLASLLAQVLTSVLSLAFLGIVAAGGNELVENVASVLVNTIGAALTSPFTAAVVVVVYFDLRVRKEGFDLELLARSVGVAPEGEPGFAAPPLPTQPPSAVDDPSRPPFWPPPPGWRPPDA